MVDRLAMQVVADRLFGLTGKIPDLIFFFASVAILAPACVLNPNHVIRPNFDCALSELPKRVNQWAASTALLALSFVSFLVWLTGGEAGRLGAEWSNRTIVALLSLRAAAALMASLSPRRLVPDFLLKRRTQAIAVGVAVSVATVVLFTVDLSNLYLLR